jgi:hypothetical protein
LGGLLFGAEGCASCHYGAHANLPTPSTGTPSEVIGDALRPFGFTTGHNFKLDYFYYEIGVGFQPAPNRVSVSWHPESGLSTIYDFLRTEAGIHSLFE